jgi:hypothetical protein
MSKGDNKAFQAGLLELIVHAVLKRLNFSPAVHPTLEGTSKRPDFGICDENGQPTCYFEVTTVNPPSPQDGKAKRAALIYNAIEEIKLPAASLVTASNGMAKAIHH